MTEAGTEITPAAFTDLLTRLGRDYAGIADPDLRERRRLQRAVPRPAPHRRSSTTTSGAVLDAIEHGATGRRLLPLVVPGQLRVGARLRAALRARPRRLRDLRAHDQGQRRATTRGSRGRTRCWSRTREARRRRRRLDLHAGARRGARAAAGLLPVDELALMDIDPGRLDVAGGLTRRMLDRAGHPARLVATVSLDEAVHGAAAVLIQLRVGGQTGPDRRRVDAARVRLPRPGDDRLRRPREGAADGARRARARGAGAGARARRVDRRLHEPGRNRDTRAPRRGAPRRRALQRSARLPAALRERCSASRPDSVELDHVGLNHLTWELGVARRGGGGAAAARRRGRRAASRRRRGCRQSSCAASGSCRRTTCTTSTTTTHSSSTTGATSRARRRWRASSRSCSSCTRDPALDEKPELLPPPRRRGLLRGGGRAAREPPRHGRQRPARREREEPRDAALPRRRRRGRGAARTSAGGEVEALPVPELGPLERGLVAHVSAYEELALDAALRGGRGARVPGAARPSAHRPVGSRRAPHRRPHRREQGLSRVGVVVGVDGGNSKTELLAATLEGEPLAYLRGPGSNAHGPGGAAGCVEVLAVLVDRARLTEPAEAAVYYLCGADVPGDIAALEAAIGRRGWARRHLVDNDTFALLRAGTDAAAAIAAVCGSGINCVGRSGSRAVRLSVARVGDGRLGRRGVTGPRGALPRGTRQGRPGRTDGARAADPVALRALRRGRGGGGSLRAAAGGAPGGAGAGDRGERRPRMRSRGSCSSGWPVRSFSSWSAHCGISS